MATRRSWYSLSLRAVLIGITLLEVLSTWLHYRAVKIREQEQILQVLAGSESRVNFRYTLLGWEVPYQFAWLWKYARPDAETIYLRPNATQALPDEFCEIARRCSQVNYEGNSGGSDAYLSRCLSARTTGLRVTRNGVSEDCVAVVGECPNLRNVEVAYITLTTKSLSALLNHPRIERLEIEAEAQDLSLLSELPAPSALQALDISLTFDWRRPRPSAPVRFERGRPVPPAPGDPPFGVRIMGDFVWLKQCPELREISLSMPRDPSFCDAIGRHLHGVERLNIQSWEPRIIESLGTWTRLRHLCLDNSQMNDAKLASLTLLCEDLQTLEIDEYSQSKVALTPEGLRSLQALKGLRRLRLGMCHLTAEHMAAIAELQQLEELSLEDRGVDDAMIEPLKGLTKLKRINLKRTLVRGKAFSAIRGDWDEQRPYRN